MLKKLVMISAILLITSIQVSAVEIGGVNLPDAITAGDDVLILNGYGLRKKFGIKVYAAGLYLKEKASDSKKILDSDETMVLRMQWRRAVPPEKINSVFFASFAFSTKSPEADVYGPDNDYGPLSPHIVKFMSWISKRTTTKKDSWIYIYTPGKGTDVYINDGEKEVLAGTIPGIEFKKALFSIWIQEDAPVGKKLRKKMLGL